MRLLLLLPVFLVLVACGGGSTSSSSDDGVVKGVVAPLDPDYRAEFDLEAVVRVAGIPLPITVTGEMTIENEGETVAWPGDPTRRGDRLTQTIVLTVPALLRLQAPELPAEIQVVTTDFVEVMDDGTWMSLGSETADPGTESTEVERVWWAEPMTLLPSELRTGQVVTNAETEVLQEDFTAVLGTRSSIRRVATATTDLDTALGRLTCFVSTIEETIRSTEPGFESLDLTYVRYEHPTEGLVRLHAEGFAYEGEYEGQPVQIEVDSLDAWIRTRTP